MPQHPSRRAVLAGAAALLAGCSAGGDDGTTEEQGTTAEPTTTTAEPTTTTSRGSVYARVYEQVSASVGQVNVETPDGPAGGTGFVVDDAHMVTNEHVVDAATEVTVRFGDGEVRPAEVVGTDVYSDLAVVRPDGLPAMATPLSFTTEEPRIGTEVLAIGTPFGLTGSVSAGIISGVDRVLPAANGFTIPDAIQTDAAANPGNSGGPLVTLDGEVAGVVNSGGGDNIAFAISAALARRVVPALIADGEYRHPYVGIRFTSVTVEVARANGLSAARGLIVTEVVDGTPADGVLQGSDGSTVIDGTNVPTGGDVIVAVDDVPIRTTGDFAGYLSLATSPGDTVAVTVIRNGERETVPLTLGTRPQP